MRFYGGAGEAQRFDGVGIGPFYCALHTVGVWSAQSPFLWGKGPECWAASGPFPFFHSKHTSQANSTVVHSRPNLPDRVGETYREPNWNTSDAEAPRRYLVCDGPRRRARPTNSRVHEEIREKLEKSPNRVSIHPRPWATHSHHVIGSCQGYPTKSES